MYISVSWWILLAFAIRCHLCMNRFHQQVDTVWSSFKFFHLLFSFWGLEISFGLPSSVYWPTFCEGWLGQNDSLHMPSYKKNSNNFFFSTYRLLLGCNWDKIDPKMLYSLISIGSLSIFCCFSAYDQIICPSGFLRFFCHYHSTTDLFKQIIFIQLT